MCAFHPTEPGITDSTDTRTFCAIHTNVESTLRCNKCGRYMCAKCAVRTPVGYRCKQCVNQQQDVYFTASQTDYIIGFVVSLVISVPVTYLVPRLGLFLIIIAGLPIGGFLGEIVHRAVGRRRGRYMWAAVAAGIVAGGILAMLPTVSQIMAVVAETQIRNPELSQAGNAATGELLSVLFYPLIFVVICAGAAIARLRYGN